MADVARSDELAQLRAELAALRQRVERDQRRYRFPRRLLPTLLVALLVALLPLAVLAANPFTDLNSGSVHNANIDAIYTAGITTGCVPNMLYCPNDFVTREQMASFLARTAGLGSNPPVAHALTAQTADSATTATTATTATHATGADNAATVGGYAPTGLLRLGQAVGVNRFEGGSINPLAVTGTFSPSNPDTSTYNDLVTIHLAAPAAGFVLVTGTVTFSISPANNTGVARLRDPLRGVASPPEYTGDAGVARGSLALTFAFPVAAGDRIITLQVTRYGATTTAFAYDGVLTALFVPFGYNGGTTLAP